MIPKILNLSHKFWIDTNLGQETPDFPELPSNAVLLDASLTAKVQILKR